MSDPIAELSHLRRCTRCALPETHESIIFDDEGVCNVCRQEEFKRDSIDWEARHSPARAADRALSWQVRLRLHRARSAGQGLTFTLYYLVASSSSSRWSSPSTTVSSGLTTLQNNVERTLKKLGVDVSAFRPNWNVVRKLMLESLMRKGDFCWHCHTGIFAYPMHIAVKFNVPLLFWGEPSAEYTSYYCYDEDEEVDEQPLQPLRQSRHYRRGHGRHARRHSTCATSSRFAIPR